jgi:hypothetical protein
VTVTATSPLELIREGILRQDWQKVCDGFAGISGVKLDPPAGAKVVMNIPEGFADLVAQKVRELILGYRPDEEEPFSPVAADDLDDDEEDEDEETPPKGEKVKAKPKPKDEEDEPESDPVSARARELRDERQGKVVDDTDKFRVQHRGLQRDDGKKACRAEPFEPGMTNRFTDDGKMAAKDIKDSKRFSKKKAPEERRPEVKKVKVDCFKCGREFLVLPLFAPKSLDKGDQSSYVCDGCIKHRR